MKVAEFSNLWFRRAGGLTSWESELPHSVFWGLVLPLAEDIDMKLMLTQAQFQT